MNLFWLCYERDGQLAGIVIIRASALIIARLRAVLLRLEPALNFAKGYELDPDIAPEIPNNVIGRLLSPSEASKLAAAFEWRQRRLGLQSADFTTRRSMGIRDSVARTR